MSKNGAVILMEQTPLSCGFEASKDLHVTPCIFHVKTSVALHILSFMTYSISNGNFYSLSLTHTHTHTRARMHTHLYISTQALANMSSSTIYFRIG
jgi:hypothetical protein